MKRVLRLVMVAIIMVHLQGCMQMLALHEETTATMEDTAFRGKEYHVTCTRTSCEFLKGKQSQYVLTTSPEQGGRIILTSAKGEVLRTVAYSSLPKFLGEYAPRAQVLGAEMGFNFYGNVAEVWVSVNPYRTATIWVPGAPLFVPITKYTNP